MARKIFTSFHYKPDNWRASQIRNMGKIEGNPIATTNSWEEVTKGGSTAIKKWIDANMSGKSCVVVFVGENTAGRKWINYEIEKAWNDSRGIFGIYVHNLKDISGNQALKGDNPFGAFTINGKSMSSIVKCYNPPYTSSQNVYDYIKNNIEDWIEKAIEIRNNH